ncbi:CMRF35-like molecule 1, partial [Astyanax mexicanus]
VISDVPTVTGYRGDSVEIRCSYDSGYETNMKYLCRGECSILFWETNDIPVESGSTAKDQRFSLKDDTAARVFTVTITDLRSEDAGQYWCGIKRSLPLTDVYTEILLLVNYETSGISVRGHEGETISITCSHSWAGSNRKYFCRDPCSDRVNDALVDSEKKSNGRYQLTDYGTGVFTVEITGITKEDSGKYWCGVKRVWPDTFNEVFLTVLDGKIKKITFFKIIRIKNRKQKEILVGNC